MFFNLPGRYLQQQQLPPPQVPRRPSDYQRSPRDQLDFFNVEEQVRFFRIFGMQTLFLLRIFNKRFGSSTFPARQ